MGGESTTTLDPDTETGQQTTETGPAEPVEDGGTPETPGGLSREDVRALASASSVTFKWSERDGGALVAGTVLNHKTFGRSVLKREIGGPESQSGAVIESEFDIVNAPQKPNGCVFHLSDADDDTKHPTWATIARLLKEGDRITLVWRVSVEDGAIKAAALNRDEVHLRINRVDLRGKGQGGSVRVYEFYVGDTITTMSDGARIASLS